jgi:hypothetical protein
MALVHSITDGTETLQLNDGTAAFTERWGMSNPGLEAEFAEDEHEIELVGGNSTVAANQLKLNRLLSQARRHNDPMTRGFGPRVFYNVQIDGATTHRCEVVGGEFVPGPARVQEEWALGSRRGTLRLRRFNWIEGPQAQISLTSINATDTTSACYVCPGDSSGTGGVKSNWLYITAAKVAGDLPAAFKLQGDFGLSPYRLLYAIYKTPAGLFPATGAYRTMHWLEDVWGVGTLTADVTRTAQTRYEATGVTTAITTAALDLSTALLASPGKDTYFRYFMAMKFDAAGTYKVTPILYADATKPIYGTPVYISGTTSFQIYDLGVMRYPNYVQGKTNQCTAKIKIETTTTVAIDADWMSVIPFSECRILEFRSNVTGTTLDDMLDYDAVYTYNVSTVVDQGLAVGDPLRLTPGLDNRLFFYALDVTTYVYDTFSVQLYYRPRYLSI